MTDPTINPTTGQPCHGKAAARVLARAVLKGQLQGPLLAEAQDALRPFGWPDTVAVIDRLGVTAVAPVVRLSPPALRMLTGEDLYGLALQAGPVTRTGRTVTGTISSMALLSCLFGDRADSTPVTSIRRVAQAAQDACERAICKAVR